MAKKNYEMVIPDNLSWLCFDDRLALADSLSPRSLLLFLIWLSMFRYEEQVAAPSDYF